VWSGAGIFCSHHTVLSKEGPRSFQRCWVKWSLDPVCPLGLFICLFCLCISSLNSRFFCDYLPFPLTWDCFPSAAIKLHAFRIGTYNNSPYQWTSIFFFKLVFKKYGLKFFSCYKASGVKPFALRCEKYTPTGCFRITFCSFSPHKDVNIHYI
jgi:hypothetical protein